MEKELLRKQLLKAALVVLFLVALFVAAKVLANSRLFKPKYAPLSHTETMDDRVLGESTSVEDLQENDNIAFYLPTVFYEDVTFKGNITADNLVTSLTAGSGIQVVGGQTPTVTNTGVLSLAGKTGALALEAGTGITIDGLKISATGTSSSSSNAIVSLTAGTGITVSGSTITNKDTGSAQNIFKTIAVVGQDEIVTDSNTDTLNFAAGTGLSIATNATTKTLTLSASGSDLNVSGWGDAADVVSLLTSTDKVGIGTTNPGAKLHVVGDTKLEGSVTLGGTASDSITFNSQIVSGSSIIPSVDLGSNLGSTTNRFNNIWVAHINTDSSQSYSGQTTFSYIPTNATITQASIIVNPTSSAANGWLTAWAVGGYQKAGVDEDGDLTIGYSGETSAPASDNPLEVYNHGNTRIAYFDASGNLNIGGSIISGSGISATGDLTIASGYSIVPSADAVNAISIGNAASADFVSFDTLHSRVGIGTTAPSYELDVQGTFNATSFYLSGTQVLSSAAELNYLDGTTALNGGIMFGNGTYLTQDATNFFWDDTNNRLGIGTTAPSTSLHILGTSEQLRLGYDATNYASFSIDAYGNLSLGSNGSVLGTFGTSGVSYNVPVTFNMAGNVDVAYDIIFSNQNYSGIKSYGPLALESGESFENNNLTLKTYGTGDLFADVGGNFLLQSADPAMVFDTLTGTDTDFWMGITEDAGGDDDDLFSIGKGTGIGTSNYLNITSGGNVGIGTTNPLNTLHLATSTESDGSGATLRLTSSNLGYGAFVYGDHMGAAGTAWIGNRGNNGVATNTAGDAIKFKNGITFYSSDGAASTIERMFISGTGNVGIGTTAPAAKLNIVDTVAAEWSKPLLVYNPNITTGQHVQVGFGVANSSYNQAEFNFNYVGGSGSTSNTFSLGLHSAADIITMKGDGNVGIGTTVPRSKLELSGGGAYISNLTYSYNTSDYYWKTGYVTEALGNTYQFVVNNGGTASTKMVIDLGGNVGIGTTAPSTTLDVVGTLKASSTVTLAGTTNCASGLVTSEAGVVSCLSSDQNLKENIVPISGALEKVKQLRGVNFSWKDKDKYGDQTELGLIAQEVEAVVPELVFTAGDGVKGVKYGQMVGLLIESIKAQQGEIDQNVSNLRALSQKVDVLAATATNTPTVSLTELQDLVIRGSLIVEAESTFKNKTTFEKIVEFMDKVVFRNQVELAEVPMFSTKDVAGQAVIPWGETMVEVKFAKPYLETPIVNITTVTQEATDSAFIAEKNQAYVTKVSKESFVIALPKAIAIDATYNWMALQVKEPIVTKGEAVLGEMIQKFTESDLLNATGEAQTATNSAQ